ncbi:MAG: yabD [Chloroflexi bacterium]|nr:yabD [Chloroflexota bacterium]
MLIDTHAHVNAPEFREDAASVLDRAAAAGVKRVICVGYDLPTTEAAIELAEQDSRVFAAAGLHPNSVAEAPGDWRTRLEVLARHPRVVAVGETGLDYYRDWTPPEAQRDAFRWHLELCDRLELPVIVHNRYADDDVADVLLRWMSSRPGVGAPGVLHSFCGPMEMMERCVAAGFAISFSGMLTFRNKSLQSLAAVAQYAPETSILIETDCPYLAPEPHRGRRNEPAFVAAVAARIADLRGKSVEYVEQLTWKNAHRVFPRLGEADGA